ncbi:tyrosine-protein phosphatase [Pontibacillus yanchengensis]|uniref:Tyrosine-protein phosphatase n=1 Tax=Pontibacillus yanchengensis Y32 TaxID=1385514 RepID=A0A0A2TG92_9BACI|nr:CpsB/CapC family capsule biosynthesis tyrosine phosphatase [Pontibacillus yanchengensis]KGP74579.1 tyrosine protein phosphatase [Pontibacillus yanchengensis Y32]
MIDVHCHILPNSDDGAKTMEESISMAKAALNDGITAVIATPHHKDGIYENEREDILKKVQSLNEVLEERGLPLTILPGQETRINGDMISDLEQGRILPLNETSGYVFVELPSDHVPRYMSQMLFDIQMSGYKPIIVHPERNRELLQNPDMLYRFVKNGAFTQVTAASVCGKFGKKIKKFTHQLIESNGFSMREAYDEVEKKFGISVRYLFSENAELLVDEKILAMDMPSKVKQRKILGLFK